LVRGTWCGDPSSPGWPSLFSGLPAAVDGRIRGSHVEPNANSERFIAPGDRDRVQWNDLHLVDEDGQSKYVVFRPATGVCATPCSSYREIRVSRRARRRPAKFTRIPNPRGSDWFRLRPVKSRDALLRKWNHGILNEIKFFLVNTKSGDWSLDCLPDHSSSGGYLRQPE